MSLAFISRALNQSCAAILSAAGEPGALQYILGGSWPITRKDIPEPSHGRVSRENFRSVYVVKGVEACSQICYLTGKESNVIAVFITLF